ncbi:MAG TPA: GNAT family N-acetyltransferase [Casimicrobiaceae bacterium]|nr:GNAT family N-acetyltransferase [Casimicrobiaceae bacterium]
MMNAHADSTPDVEVDRADPVLLDAVALDRHRDELVAILADAIESNASVGYILPIDATTIAGYWQKVIEEVAAGERYVFGTFVDDRLVGSVQLVPCAKPNQPHRADVQKLLVRSEWRGQGIGERLMIELEALALAQGRWLLLLDTRTGSKADALYTKWGWQVVGRVPDFALDPDGRLADCTFYWKRLSVVSQ